MEGEFSYISAKLYMHFYLSWPGAQPLRLVQHSLRFQRQSLQQLNKAAAREFLGAPALASRCEFLL